MISPEGQLIYVLKGKLAVHLGEVSERLGAGDVVHEVAGIRHHFEALQDTVVLEVNIPPKAGSAR